MAQNSIASRGPRSSVSITDPKALRALAHPIRMSLIGLLRTEGPLTATRAAELLGESSASCSFHFRQLAKYGMAEEAPGGQGRERPWQATTMSTNIPDFSDDPDFVAASSMYRTVLAWRYFEWLMRWLDQRPHEPAEWQQAEMLGDWLLYLTPQELTGLGEKVHALVEPYLDRTAQPELRPEGARLISFLRFAFPMIGPPIGTGKPGARAAGDQPGDETGGSPGDETGGDGAGEDR